MSVAEITDGNQLAGFVEALGKMEGKALAAQLAIVISHPTIFVFGELLDLANVRKVCTTISAEGLYMHFFNFVFTVLRSCEDLSRHP